jgi:hypothetical protein
MNLLASESVIDSVTAQRVTNGRVGRPEKEGEARPRDGALLTLHVHSSLTQT